MTHGEQMHIEGTALIPTKHGLARLRQRGITMSDLELLMLVGSGVEGGHLVLEKDYQAFERELKHVLHRARRLVGKRVVVADGRVVTAYHASRRNADRLVRRAG